MDQLTYNAGYLASLPPTITNLMKLPVGSLRNAGAVQLVQSGWVLDAQIMVFGQDPFDTMYERYVAGFKSVPAFLEEWPNNPPIPPGLVYNGVLGSTNQGSIEVYYPNPPAPLNPPAPPPVGPSLTLSIPIIGYPGYFEMNGDSSSIPVGYKIQIGVDYYTKTVISQSPFAPNGVVTGWFQTTS